MPAKAVLFTVLVLSICVHKIASLEDEIDDPAADDGTDSRKDDDYSEPGVTTEPCLCVPFTQCDEGEIVSDGSFLINPRKRPGTPLSERKAATLCGPYHVCCTDPDASTVSPHIHRCGVRNPGGINGRILSANGNSEAEFGEWPWQAAVLRKENEVLVYKCGGTLIDEWHILTAAHCAEEFKDDPSFMVVRLGEWDTQITTEFMPHEDFAVSEILIHPKYTRKNLFNDIAVVRLSSKVNFKSHIDSVCLPKGDDDFVGQTCVVTGWGANAYEEGDYAVVMKEITVPVLSHEECQKRLRTTRLGKFFRLHKGFLCAGGEEGTDSCKGDGGGPLMCSRDGDIYTLAGLVAWGIDCGKAGIPGVYVNVKNYLDWITAVTEKPLAEYWSSPK